MTRGPDVSRLGPSDALAALRSFPRRFRAAVALRDDEDDSVLRRVGPDGASAAEHVDRAGRTLAVLDRALQQVLASDNPALHPGVVDESAREFTGESPSVEAALDLVELEAGAMAETVDPVDADAWLRTGTVAGGGTVTALDIVREAVRSVAAELADTEKAVSAAR